MVTVDGMPARPGPHHSDWPAGQVTGDRSEPTTDNLRAAVESLDDLDELPVGEHVAYFDVLHTALQDALASIDGV